MNKNKFDKETIASLQSIMQYKVAKKPAGAVTEPQLEGISFRFKTVQFHVIDDTFEELKKDDRFGDLKIYSERFSLPGYGSEEGELSGDEYQFEVTCLVEADEALDQETYLRELTKILEKIAEKHDLDVVLISSGEFFNINTIIWHTSKKGVFSEE